MLPKPLILGAATAAAIATASVAQSKDTISVSGDDLLGYVKFARL